VKDPIWFTSDLFERQPGEEEETNPGCLGKALAGWVGARLEERGLSVGEVLAEDWGWIVPVEDQPFPLWVGCGNEDGSERRWMVFAQAEPNPIRRLFKRDETERALDALQRHLLEVLESDPAISDLEPA
jgi:hypothetical protein